MTFCAGNPKATTGRKCERRRRRHVGFMVPSLTILSLCAGNTSEKYPVIRGGSDREQLADVLEGDAMY